MTLPLAGIVEANGVDAITIAVSFAVALGAPLVRRARGVSPAISGPQATVDFLNGSVIFPFVLLIGSAFDGGVLQMPGDARISVALAGGVGLFFILGELSRSCATPATVATRRQP